MIRSQESNAKAITYSANPGPLSAISFGPQYKIVDIFPINSIRHFVQFFVNCRSCDRKYNLAEALRWHEARYNHVMVKGGSGSPELGKPLSSEGFFV